MAFMAGQDGWVEVGKAVVLGGAVEVLSWGAFVVDWIAYAVLRLCLWSA